METHAGTPIPRELIEALVELGLATHAGHHLFQGYRMAAGLPTDHDYDIDTEQGVIRASRPRDTDPAPITPSEGA